MDVIEEKPKLSVVITFRNEGDEIRRTVESIRSTSSGQVEIILINDASNDDYPYLQVARQYACRYESWGESKGPGFNRHFGVLLAKADTVLLLDAHMRFYQTNWVDRLIECTTESPKTVFCTASKPLNAQGEKLPYPEGRGATVNMITDCAISLFLPAWNTRTPAVMGGETSVPCILGATYCFKKDYFLYLEGYEGLFKYGGEEAFLSMKSWLIGDGCKVIDDVSIGHIYKSGNPRPWHSEESFYAYNKLLLAATVFPVEQFESITRVFAAYENYPMVMRQFKQREEGIVDLRKRIQSKMRRPVDYFIELNDSFRQPATHS
ncbi:MAG: glycosyltransferase [Limnobacter sp.]|nr:glycosyltransferase [Limnobacter sp.]